MEEQHTSEIAPEERQPGAVIESSARLLAAFTKWGWVVSRDAEQAAVDTVRACETYAIWKPGRHLFEPCPGIVIDPRERWTEICIHPDFEGVTIAFSHLRVHGDNVTVYYRMLAGVVKRGTLPLNLFVERIERRCVPDSLLESLRSLHICRETLQEARESYRWLVRWLRRAPSTR